MAGKTYRIGEKKLQKNGLMAEIIDYPRGLDMTVRFEDGKVIHHVTYHSFKHGMINYNKTDDLSHAHTYHVGEKTVCSNEMVATIIAYRSFCDIDVEFDDGLIVEHVTYSSFSQHSIHHPDHKPVIWSRIIPLQKDIGRKKRTLDGYRELIKIHDNRFVDYIDDDGSLVKQTSYSDFLGKNMTIRKWKKGGIIKEYTY